MYKFIRDNGGWTEEWCMVMVKEYPDCKTKNELHQYERDAYDFYKPDLNINRPALRHGEEIYHLCIPCGYSCCKKSHLVKHFSSKKHMDKIQNPDAVIVGRLKCPNCDKMYKSKQGLWSHKKICKAIAVAVAVAVAVQVPPEIDLHAEIVNLKGMIIEMANNLQPTSITNNNNNYINIFLNDKCHNAYDIKKFIASIDFSKENFEKLIQDYVDGNAEIITKNYKSLPEYESG